MGVLAIARPFLYATNRVFATRLLHTVLRGVSRDRLDLLGEEFFQYFLKPRLKAAGVARLKEIIASGAGVVFVRQGLDHIRRVVSAAIVDDDELPGIDLLRQNGRKRRRQEPAAIKRRQNDADEWWRRTRHDAALSDHAPRPGLVASRRP
jgi:hypothetical protein